MPGFGDDPVDPIRVLTDARPSPDLETVEHGQDGVLAHGPH